MKGFKIPYNPKPVNPIDEYTEVKIWWHARPQDVLIISKDQFLILDNSHYKFFFKNSIISVKKGMLSSQLNNAEICPAFSSRITS